MICRRWVAALWSLRLAGAFPSEGGRNGQGAMLDARQCSDDSRDGMVCYADSECGGCSSCCVLAPDVPDFGGSCCASECCAFGELYVCCGSGTVCDGVGLGCTAGSTVTDPDPPAGESTTTITVTTTRWETDYVTETELITKYMTTFVTRTDYDTATTTVNADGQSVTRTIWETVRRFGRRDGETAGSSSSPVPVTSSEATSGVEKRFQLEKRARVTVTRTVERTTTSTTTETDTTTLRRTRTVNEEEARTETVFEGADVTVTTTATTTVREEDGSPTSYSDGSDDREAPTPTDDGEDDGNNSDDDYSNFLQEESNRIALGIGIGLGVPMFIVALWGVVCGPCSCWRSRN